MDQQRCIEKEIDMAGDNEKVQVVLNEDSDAVVVRGGKHEQEKEKIYE